MIGYSELSGFVPPLDVEFGSFPQSAEVNSLKVIPILFDYSIGTKSIGTAFFVDILFRNVVIVS